MILVIDNYDSFVYNLVQYMGEIRKDIKVFRNDEITVADVRRMRPDRIVISPGPCTPDEAGISTDVIKNFYASTPILGVCLGHQCLVRAFGGEVVRAKRLMHGKTSMIKHDARGLFRGIKGDFEATRYHSLIAEASSFPKELYITARSADKNEIMGARVKGPYCTEGVQFHPESILTSQGKLMVRNFLEMKLPGKVRG